MKFLGFFHMRENPFGETPDINFYYPSRFHEAAMQKISWSIEADKSFVLVSGEVGAGKTMLSRMLHAAHAQDSNIAMIMNPPSKSEDLLRALCSDIGMSKREVSLEKLNAFLLRSVMAGKRNILIIDEAQRLSDEGLEFVRLLTNLETDKRKLLQVILIAQPEIESRLQQNSLRQLYQRIFLKVDLPFLNAEETQRYIRHRLETSGGGMFVRFEKDAIDKIFALSGGAPRIINKICELALCFAALQQRRHIEAKWLMALPLADIGVKRKRFNFMKFLGAHQ